MEEKTTTEKDVILEIQKSLKDAGKLEQEQNMIMKRGILNAIGFENKEPKVEDEEFVKNTLKVVSDELLNGSYIDLDLLQKVVQLQNGINTIDLSPSMKKVIHDEGVLNNMPSINQNENIAKLKYHMEEGNIDPNQEWIEILKERNSQFFNIEHDENYLFHIQKQIPLNNLPAMSVSENPSIELEPQKAPQLSISLEEEAKMKYLQIIDNKGWVERKFNQEDDTEITPGSARLGNG